MFLRKTYFLYGIIYVDYIAAILRDEPASVYFSGRLLRH